MDDASSPPSHGSEDAFGSAVAAIEAGLPPDAIVALLQQRRRLMWSVFTLDLAQVFMPQEWAAFSGIPVPELIDRTRRGRTDPDVAATLPWAIDDRLVWEAHEAGAATGFGEARIHMYDAVGELSFWWIRVYRLAHGDVGNPTVFVFGTPLPA